MDGMIIIIIQTIITLDTREYIYISLIIFSGNSGGWLQNFQKILTKYFLGNANMDGYVKDSDPY